MSLADRFRRQPANRTSAQPDVEQRAPKPKTLRLAGQIRQDHIFPTDTDTEQQ